jgi:hypothetical protein
MIEVLYARYGGRYLREFDTTEEAFGYIESGEDTREISAIGIFQDGVPVIWDGYAQTVVPNDEQRTVMLAEYERAKGMEVRNDQQKSSDQRER